MTGIDEVLAHDIFTFDVDKMLLFKRLLATGVASVELKKAILVNGLVNLQGKEDTSYRLTVLMNS